jgi:hypothetical protein
MVSLEGRFVSAATWLYCSSKSEALPRNPITLRLGLTCSCSWRPGALNVAIIYPSKALFLRVTLPPSLLSYGASRSSALMALEGQVSPFSNSLPRTSTHVSSRPFHHRVWSGLSGRDRPWIGWKRSASAIVFSSCQSSLRFDAWEARIYARSRNTLLTLFATQGSIFWSSSFLLPGYPTSTNGHMDSPLHVCHDPSPSFPAFTEYLFPVSFLAIVSLEKTFDWGGEQLAMYCGPDLGDLIIITLNKYVLFTAPWLDQR